MSIVTDKLTVTTTLVNGEHIDEIGQVADALDNLVAALSMPMPDSLHVEAIREALPELSECLKAVVREATGEDPWE